MRQAALSDLPSAGRIAYETANRHFDVQHMQRRYEALFLRLMGRE